MPYMKMSPTRRIVTAQPSASKRAVSSSGFQKSLTMSNRLGRTCDSQKPKKTRSYERGGRAARLVPMDVDVLFVGVAVTDFTTARTWYERFFGRSADVVAHDNEVMWQTTDRGWLYIVRDVDHAGNSIVALAVRDIEAATTALNARNIATGPIEPEGDAGRKAVIRDPDGNSIAIIEVAEA
jgi:glyoxylase I family protein